MEEQMKKQKVNRRCLECGNETMITGTETRRYPVPGGWSVVVEGAQVTRCPACGLELIGFESSGGIERAVAEQVIGKAAHLAGEELIFLRELLDWTGRKMAAILGVGASTVSRWENGHETITGAADRLVRMVAAVHLGLTRDWTRQHLEAVLEGIEDKKAPPLKVRVRMSGSDGQRKVAA
jgi:putative zinc finger/helix-turn-helix YgiT family protein